MPMVHHSFDLSSHTVDMVRVQMRMEGAERNHSVLLHTQSTQKFNPEPMHHSFTKQQFISNQSRQYAVSRPRRGQNKPINKRQ